MMKSPRTDDAVTLVEDADAIAVWSSDTEATALDALFAPSLATMASDVAPIDAFAALVGTLFYDADRLERISAPETVTVGTLLARTAFGSQLLPQVPAPLRDRPARALILLHGYRGGATMAAAPIAHVANLTRPK